MREPILLEEVKNLNITIAEQNNRAIEEEQAEQQKRIEIVGMVEKVPEVQDLCKAFGIEEEDEKGEFIKSLAGFLCKFKEAYPGDGTTLHINAMTNVRSYQKKQKLNGPTIEKSPLVEGEE